MSDTENAKGLLQAAKDCSQSKISQSSHDTSFVSASTWKKQKIEEQRMHMQKIAEHNRIEQERKLKRYKSATLEPVVRLEEQVLTHNNEEKEVSFLQSEPNETIENSEVVAVSLKTPKTKKEVSVFTVKTTKKSVFLNIAIVLLCFTGAYYALQAYYDAINTSFVKLDEEPVGTIVYKHKIAQRKMTDHVAWDRLQQNSPIYNGDLIRTAELSEATITFMDGSSIDLFNQTLTQVFYDENGAVIDFSGGEISVNTTNSQSGIRLISGETEVNLAKGAILNASAQTEENNGITTFIDSPVVLQLTEGDADILVDNNGEKEHLAVEIGSAVILDPITNNIEVPELTLVSPTTQLTYLKNNSESLIVPFEWRTRDSNPIPITLEISAYNDFSEIAENYTFDNTTAADIPFESGAWYWRMIATGSEISPTGKVTVFETNNTVQITPIEKAEYFYRTKTPSVRFVWQDDENVIDWLFEVADNDTMQNPIISQKVTQPSAILNMLDAGTWYWRVTPYYSSRYVLTDIVKNYEPPVQSFSIVQQRDLFPTTLLSPAMQGFVNTKNVDTSQFVWKYDREAAFYTITVSENEDLSNPVVTKQTTDTFFALKEYANDISDGRWYWTVTKTDSEGNVFPAYSIGSFYAIDGEAIYETLAPENAQVFTEQTIQQVQFKWENNLPFQSVLQVSKDSLFNDVLLEKELDTVVKQGILSDISLPNGLWYWRTVSINEETGIEYSTDAKYLFVDFTLTDVVLTNPVENATLKTHDAYRQTFSWRKVENADYYNFALYSRDNLETPLYEQLQYSQTNLHLDISDYADGEYEWHVQAVSNDTPSGRIQETNVAVHLFVINAIKPVALTGLSRSVQFDGVSALVNPQSIGWASSETIVSSEFILSKTNRGLRVSDVENNITARESDIVKRVQNPSNSIELPPLNEGTYYWTVLAHTTGGIDIRAVQPRIITVLPLALLPAVKGMTPEQNIVLHTSDIQKGFIDFTWVENDTADEYHFMLYNQNNELLWETVSNETGVHFDIISLLDRGTFTWTVEAVRILPNNTVQRGRIAGQTFTIDIGEQVIPKDKTSGGQYGF